MPDSPILRRALRGAVVAAGLCALVLPRVFEAGVGYPAVVRAAEARVDESLERNTVTFLSLSGIKAVMASIEGSAVGVGFHFEMGDLIQPAYDYVDFVWHAFLYALALLGLYKLGMETGILGLGFPLLGIGMLRWAAGGLDLAAAAALRRWGRRAIALGLVVIYVVPVALLVSHFAAQRYLVPLEARTAARIEETREPLADAAERMRRLREKISILEPAKSVDAVSREAKAIADQVSNAIWERLQAFLALVLILLVELLLLPFLSAFVIYRVLSLAARGPD
ncbi:MAG: hypothetical protein JSU66_10655 [Deltaproteobacteria bacterium]|nr:MAG: hypothetical protein JSU66_10655 [Deltaproteobacteria bacterium]